MKNVGGIDRTLRIILGAVFIIYGVMHLHAILGIIGLILGIVFVLTGIIGTCVLYLPFGIRTCPLRRPEDQRK
ncbi:MAG: DUF2892 domain-containing protein [Acidibacillus sp.]|nr:DUF2892 domain-containing protein [Acidibacillus sp.]